MYFLNVLPFLSLTLKFLSRTSIDCSISLKVYRLPNSVAAARHSFIQPLLLSCVPAWGGGFAKGDTWKAHFRHSGSLCHVGSEYSFCLGERGCTAIQERWIESNSATCVDSGKSLKVPLPQFSEFIHLTIQ